MLCASVSDTPIVLTLLDRFRDPHDDSVGQGDEGTLLPPAGGDAAVLGGQGAGRGLGGDVGHLDQHLA